MLLRLWLLLVYLECKEGLLDRFDMNCSGHEVPKSSYVLSNIPATEASSDEYLGKICDLFGEKYSLSGMYININLYQSKEFLTITIINNSKAFDSINSP